MYGNRRQEKNAESKESKRKRDVRTMALCERVICTMAHTKKTNHRKNKNITPNITKIENGGNHVDFFFTSHQIRVHEVATMSNAAKSLFATMLWKRISSNGKKKLPVYAKYRKKGRKRNEKKECRAGPNNRRNKNLSKNLAHDTYFILNYSHELL